MKDLDFLLHYPNLESCSLQTFDDQHNRKLKHLAKILPYTDTVHEQLKELNKQGAGIFFSVNSMKEGKRDQASVTHINSWICEVDDYSKEEQQKMIKRCPIKPSMIIESKKSYHMYWFAKDGIKENFALVGRGLAEYFSGDRKACIDSARVLRFPGYNHVKNPDDSFRIKTIHFKQVYHTEQDMMNAYPWTPPETKKIKVSRIDGDNFREVVNSWSAEGMLSRISGTDLVRGDIIDFSPNSNGTKQIVCNGESTGCWIDKNDKIGSGDEGGPSRVNRVFRYGYYDGAELAKWIQDNCDDLLPDNLKNREKKPNGAKAQKIEQTEELFDGKKSTYYPTGIDHIDKAFKGSLGGQDFVVFTGRPNMGKTNFARFFLEQNAKMGNKGVFVSMELPMDIMKKRYAREKVGLTKYQTQRGEYTEEQRKLLNKYANELNSNPNLLYTTFDKRPTVETIVEQTEGWYKDGYRIFVYDNLGKFDGPSEEQKRYQHISDQLQLMKNKPGHEDMLIILLHHLTKRGDNDYLLPGGRGKIRGSGKLGDDATILWEIFRKLNISEDGTILPSNDPQVMLIQSKDTPGGHTNTARIYFHKGDYMSEFDYQHLTR